MDTNWIKPEHPLARGFQTKLKGSLSLAQSISSKFKFWLEFMVWICCPSLQLIDKITFYPIMGKMNSFENCLTWFELSHKLNLNWIESWVKLRLNQVIHLTYGLNQAELTLIWVQFDFKNKLTLSTWVQLEQIWDKSNRAKSIFKTEPIQFKSNPTWLHKYLGISLSKTKVTVFNKTLTHLEKMW